MIPPCARNPRIDWTIEPTETIDKTEVAETREAAAGICATCPLRQPCGDTAEAARLDRDGTIRPFGVYAGRFYDGTRRPPTDLLREQHIRRMVAEGICDALMADRLGLTVGQVRSTRDRLGLRTGSRQNMPPGPRPTVSRRNPPLRPTFKHGTKAGYHCHQRRNEPPCEPCRQAKNAYDRAYNARVKAAA